MFTADQAKTLPTFEECDVVVAGGGMAGFGAAAAASRAGAKTLLIERMEMLGGLGSTGMVGNFSYGHHKVKAQGKIFDDVLALLEELGGIGEENGYREHEGVAKQAKVYRQDGSGEYDLKQNEPIFFNRTFNAALLPVALQHLALGYGIEILYATDIVGAVVEKGEMREAIIHNRSLLQRVPAKVFIDSTGEGILSRHAGATELSREDPEHPEFIQPSNMIFLHSATGNHHAKDMPLLEQFDEPPIRWSVWPEPDRVGLKMGMFHKRYDNADGKGHSAAVTDFRRHIPRYMQAFQEQFPERYGSNLTFEFAAPMLGIRESSRIEGDYVLTVDDLLHGRHFEDAVAFAMSVLDSQFTEKEKVPPFQIPYRSLLVKGLSNVFVAGRCFSASRKAMSSTRVMPTGCLMGQACGYSAAIAVKTGADIRSVDPATIRAQLIKDATDADYMAFRLKPESKFIQ